MPCIVSCILIQQRKGFAVKKKKKEAKSAQYLETDLLYK